MRRFSPRPLTLAVTLALAGAPALGHAAGMAMFANGVKQVGTAFSGSAAAAEDTATIAYNPAGLMRLQGTQSSVGVNLLMLDGRFDGHVERTRIPGDEGRVDGTGRQDLDVDAVVPHVYLSHRLSDNAAVGFGVYVPYGASGEFDEGWAGRYHALESEFTGINFNPVFAFRPTRSLSLGFGAIIQYFDLRLTNDIDVGYLLADGVYHEVAAQEGEAAAQAAMDAVLPVVAHNFDIYNEITGDSIGYAFNFGLLWEPFDGARLGLNYRSDTRHLVEGRAHRPEVDDEAYRERLQATLENVLPDPDMVPDVMAQALGPAGAMGGPLQSTVHLPETVSLGLYYDITPRLAVQAGGTWIRWSRMQEFRFEYTDDSLRGGSRIGEEEDVRRRDLVQPLNWADAWTYGIGVTYKPSERLALRAGYAIDQTPIQRPEDRSPRSPDNDRTLISLGASLGFSSRMSVDFAYMLMMFEDSEVANLENPAGTNHRIVGEFTDVRAHLAGIQFNYQF